MTTRLHCQNDGRAWRPRPRLGSLVREMPSERPEPFRFPLGRIVATPGALEAITRAMLRTDPGAAGVGLAARYLVRHGTGDWGDLTPDDQDANEHAVTAGERILSAYNMPGGERLWIITEADRSATTLLLPSEY